MIKVDARRINNDPRMIDCFVEIEGPGDCLAVEFAVLSIEIATKFPIVMHAAEKLINERMMKDEEEN